jgi:DNA replication protein DnaC
MADAVEVAEIIRRELAIGLETALPEAELRAREERMRREALLAEASPAITPEDIAAIVDGKLKKTKSLGHVRQWLEIAWGTRESRTGRPVRFLALVGAVGVGKTVAAAYALAHEPGLYVTAEELRRRLCSSNWRDFDWQARVLRARLVVVDDLGAESREGSREALFELVNRRMGEERALTLLTGNLTESELIERYDARTIDRLQYVGIIVEIAGESMRKRGAL